MFLGTAAADTHWANWNNFKRKIQIRFIYNGWCIIDKSEIRMFLRGKRIYKFGFLHWIDFFL